MTFQEFRNQNNLVIIRTYNDYSGKSISICKSMSGVIAVEYELKSGRIIGKFVLERNLKYIAPFNEGISDTRPRQFSIEDNTLKTIVISIIILAFSIFGVYLLVTEDNSTSDMIQNISETKKGVSSRVSLTAEMLSQMMGGFYEIESKGNGMVIQEIGGANQLILHKKGGDRISVNGVTKKIIKGAEGDGLLYTGYGLAPKAEMIIVALRILNNNTVKVTLIVSGNESKFQGTIKSIR